MLDVAGAAVPRTSRQDRCVGTLGRSVGFPGLLHGAFDAETLHVLVGRDLRVDEMAFDHQRQRHAEDEESHGRHGAQYEYQPGRHKFEFLGSAFAVSGTNVYICRINCKNAALFSTRFAARCGRRCPTGRKEGI